MSASSFTCGEVASLSSTTSDTVNAAAARGVRPLPAGLVCHRAVLGDESAYLVQNGRATLMTRPHSYNGWFIGAVQEITPHDLRHTCASLAISAGANVMALSRMLGHKDKSETLNTYADLFDDDLDRVANAMRKLYEAVTPCQNLVTEPDKIDKAA
ncbi:tyrosine-type recombinase/integrase [Nocardia seriolae]|nr:tyrosine-type recombinase/integrase [Nocardia seriolae]MTJ72522.1 tyrosine-type recombinase/integrase [Nocardia seriolae]MTJ84848.1 tyrosine-type recombinase/integrase [Nocardia seriolae]MTK28844.1 tyrosine-type recombinase/integrase [Nocardia seriolae]MTK44969.1 tyrosine-type recombinase/integrase [Nocardia seriolae]